MNKLFTLLLFSLILNTASATDIRETPLGLEIDGERIRSNSLNQYETPEGTYRKDSLGRWTNGKETFTKDSLGRWESEKRVVRPTPLGWEITTKDKE